MDKATITIDMPPACCECPLRVKRELEYVGDFTYKQFYHCWEKPDVTLSKDNLLSKRPGWCPLKPAT